MAVFAHEKHLVLEALNNHGELFLATVLHKLLDQIVSEAINHEIDSFND